MTPTLDTQQAWLKPALWYLIEKALRMGGNLAAMLWLAHSLSREDFGTLAFVTSLAALASTVGSLGIEGMISRDLAQHPDRSCETLSNYLALRLGGGLMGSLAVIAYVAFLHRETASLMLMTCLLIIVLPMAAWDAIDCYLQATGAAKTSARIHGFAFAASATVKCMLAGMGAPLFTLMLAQGLETLLVAIQMQRVAGLAGVAPTWRHLRLRRIKEMLFGGRSLVGAALAVAIYTNIDAIAVAEAVSREALASYSIAIALCGGWNSVSMSITQVFSPQLARSRLGDYQSYIVTLRKLLGINLGVSLLGCIILPPLVSIGVTAFLGAQYDAINAIFPILLAASVPIFLGVATSQIIIVERIHWVSLVRTMIAAILTLATTVPFTAIWGARGAASGVLLCSTLATLGILLSATARNVLTDALKFSRTDTSPPTARP